MDSAFLRRLAKGTIVFDGATGTQFQAAGLPQSSFVLPDTVGMPDDVLRAAERLGGQVLDGCNEVLCLTEPELVFDVHARYLKVGSDIVEANTFGAISTVLAEYAIPELSYSMSLLATKLAREACDQFSTAEKPRFVAGGIGPGTKLVSLGQVSFDDLVTTSRDCARGMIDGGADVILLETLQDLLMVKAAIVGATEAMEQTGKRLPIMVQVTLEQTGTMLVGSELSAALNMVEAFPQVVSIGMNCATGPAEMAQHVRFLGENSTRPISVQPNAGLPVMEKGKAVYKLSPSELADYHEEFVATSGVAMVGGCCGTTPAHIEAVHARVGDRPHSGSGYWQSVQNVFPRFDFGSSSGERAAAVRLKGCSSLYQFVPYEQDASFLIVGERTNANGSKAFREMLAAEDWGGMTELAREVESEGSHVLDVCTAYVGRDEKRDMETLLKLYNRHVTAPIMIDSTEVPVIEAALRTLAGKPIINSVNFEDGEARTRQVLGLCRKYGAAVVALTIDETGMAKTVEHKLEVAARLVAATREQGIPDHDLFIDCLTFTLGSGDEEFRQAGVATIEAIARLRETYPGVNTVLGVSNISFGLKPAARVVLNSAFLHFAREAGLTSAIVHASKIVPESRVEGEVWQIASDLVFDRRRYA